MLPSDLKQERLLSKAGDLVRAATALAGKRVPPELHVLLRSMNSYYTNRIEGQHTRPHEIEQALRKDFSANKELAAKQRLAVAHIEAEAALEQRYAGEEAVATLYSQQAVQAVHNELFGRLPEQDWKVNEGQVVVLGQLRAREVSVGLHIATAAAHVPEFLARWAQRYGCVRRGEAALVVEATVRKSGVRPESLRALHYLFLSGEELARGEFKSMLGLSDRLATDALGALVKRGYLRSDSPQGKVRFGLPQHALQFLFPKLWPEVEADVSV